MTTALPKFTDLPLRKADPPLSAWGLYGDKDELGTLNRLTPSVIRDAAKEIRMGERISLDWPLSAQSVPFFGRQPFQHHIFNKHPRCVNDDVWTFNTQSSSQWDGLRHFAYQSERQFYNGRRLGDFGLGEEGAESDRASGEEGRNVLGIQAMGQKGIVGRGILVDWGGYRAATKPDYDPEAFTDKTQLGLDELQKVLRWQETEVQFGDILLIRSGYLQAFNQMSQKDIEPLSKVNSPSFIGVKQDEDVVRWLFENFSAVAGDMPAFESFPPKQISDKYPKCLHEVLLAGWGMPIGELFNLEDLAEHCRSMRRWDFFMTSKVCDVPGGVASPPNALAIF